jgi:tetratricopeptide (TPR) repeat protein
MRAGSGHRPAQKGDLAAAEIEFRSESEQLGDKPSEELAMAYFKLGLAQKQHRNFVNSFNKENLKLADKATKTLNKAHDIASQVLPENAELLAVIATQQAQLCSCVHDYKGAVAWYRKGFRHLRDPTSRAVDGGVYGNALTVLREFEKALVILERYMPRLTSVLEDAVICDPIASHGYCLCLAGHVQRGASVLQRAIRGAASAGNPDVQEKASSWLREAKKLSKCNTAEDWKLAANDYFADGDIRAAICLYGVALKTAPHDAKILANRALCNFKVGRLHSAIDDARRSMKADSTYKRARTILVNSLRELGQLDEARKEVQALLALDPADAASTELEAEVNAAVEKAGGEEAVAKKPEHQETLPVKADNDGDGAATAGHDDDDDGPPPLETPFQVTSTSAHQPQPPPRAAAGTERKVIATRDDFAQYVEQYKRNNPDGAPLELDVALNMIDAKTAGLDEVTGDARHDATRREMEDEFGPFSDDEAFDHGEEQDDHDHDVQWDIYGTDDTAVRLTTKNQERAGDPFHAGQLLLAAIRNTVPPADRHRYRMVYTYHNNGHSTFATWSNLAKRDSSLELVGALQNLAIFKFAADRVKDFKIDGVLYQLYDEDDTPEYTARLARAATDEAYDWADPAMVRCAAARMMLKLACREDAAYVQLVFDRLAEMDENGKAVWLQQVREKHMKFPNNTATLLAPEISADSAVLQPDERYDALQRLVVVQGTTFDLVLRAANSILEASQTDDDRGRKLCRLLRSVGPETQYVDPQTKQTITVTDGVAPASNYIRLAAWKLGQYRAQILVSFCIAAYQYGRHTMIQYGAFLPHWLRHFDDFITAIVSAPVKELKYPKK